MIDDRFLTGLYYDAHFGDVVGFGRDEENEEIILYDPGGDEIDRIDPIDFEPGDLYRLPDEAVDDPAEFFESLIDRCIDVDALDLDSYAAYEYVKDRVKVVNSNEVSVSDQWIGTEAGHVHKRFETWEQAEEYREGHARDVFAMPRLTEAEE